MDDFRRELAVWSEGFLEEMPPEDLALIRATISRCASRDTSKARGSDYAMSAAVQYMASLEIEAHHVSGHDLAPQLGRILAHDVPAFTNETLLERTGLTADDFSRAWREVERRGAGAILPDDLLFIALPAPLWPALLSLIKEGPGALHRRLAEALFLRGNAGQGDSGVCAQTLKTQLVTPARRLTEILIEMRGIGFPHPALDAWVSPLPRVDVRKYASPGDRDVAAPPIAVIRAVLKPMYESLMQATDGGRRLPPNRFRELRDFCLGTAFVLTASRADALQDISIGDLAESHNWPDATLPPSPAVLLSVAKQAPNEPPRWKALDARLLPLLRLYMKCAGIDHQPLGQPLWVGRKYQSVLPEDAPRCRAFDFYDRVSGSKSHYEDSLDGAREREMERLVARGATQAELEAALARVAGTAGLPLFPRPGGEPWEGYRLHSAGRSVGIQLHIIAAQHYLDSPEGKHTIGLKADRYALAASVADHEISKADPYQYNVCASDANRENNSARLAPYVWDLIFGDLGAPHGIDRRRVKALREELESAERQIAVTERALQIIDEEEASARTAVRARLRKRRRPQMSAQAFFELEREEDLRIEEIEKNARRDRLQETAHLKATTQRASELRQLLIQAETTEVPLPYREDPDFDPRELLDENADVPDEMSSASDGAGQSAGTPKRDTITLAECAVVMFGDSTDKSLQKIRGWLREADFPKRPRNVPWTLDQLRNGEVIDPTSTERNRRLNVACFNLDKLTVGQQRDLRVMLAREPD